MGAHRRHTIQRRRLASVLGAAIAIGTAAPAHGQDVHAYLARGTTDHPAFPGTTGVGVGIALPLDSWFTVAVQLDRRASELDRIGRACVRPTLEHQCGNEPIETRNTFASVGAAALATWQPLSFTRFGVGLGALVGTTDSANAPRSGRQADVFVQRTAHLGLLGRFLVRVQPAHLLPLYVLGLWDIQRVSLGSCSGGPETYSPFCGVAGFSEFKVGLGFGL